MPQQTVSYAINKFTDIIAEALGILDYSYIVSGTMSYLIILFTLNKCDALTFPCHGIYLFLLSLFLAYILGLISWTGGRTIRKWFVNKDSFEKVYDSAVPQKEKSKVDSPYKDKKIAYTLMWKSLYDSKDDKGLVIALDDMKRIRRYWVMQAIFEGLIGTCTIGILCVICYVVHGLLGEEGRSILWYLLLAFPLIGLMVLFAKEAKDYAETQITEVITSYYKYNKIN